LLSIAKVKNGVHRQNKNVVSDLDTSVLTCSRLQCMAIAESVYGMVRSEYLLTNLYRNSDFHVSHWVYHNATYNASGKKIWVHRCI